MLRELLDKRLNPNEVDQQGRTPLHHAAMSFEKDSVDLLLRRGARVNVVDSQGISPLLLAAQWSNAAVVRALLDGGANPNDADRTGANALHHAVGKGDREIVSLLIKRGGKQSTSKTDSGSPLMHAAAENRLTLMRELLDAGGMIDEPSAFGITPAMGAARSGAGDAFFSAYARGANLNARDNQGGTILHHAATAPASYILLNNFPLLQGQMLGSPNRIVSFLIAKGIDPNVRDNLGNTPLHFAARFDNPSHVADLVALGAKANLINQKGESVCSMATNSRNKGLVIAELRRVGACD